MSKSLNKAILIGHVGQDPEVRYTGTGKAVATFSLATTDSWKDKNGQQQERTDWHKIVAWERVAEIMQQYVKKGSRLYIEGRISNTTYDDKEGVKRSKSEVVVSDFMFLDGNKGSSSNGGSEYSSGGSYNARQSGPVAAAPPVAEFDSAPVADDLPF